MICAHSSHVMVQLADNLFVISGKNNQNIVSTNCEVYNIEENT